MQKSTYKASTIGYGLVFILALISIIYSIIINKPLIIVLSIIIAIVALDNFLCASRANKAGYKTSSHYTIPKFLKK